MARKVPPSRSVEPDWFLREWMDTLEVRQTDLIRETGWAKSRVSEIVNGKTDYYREIVNTLASVLKIHPWELLMLPEEAHHIKRLRAMLDEEVHLRVAEAQQGYTLPPPPRDRKAG